MSSLKKGLAVEKHAPSPLLKTRSQKDAAFSLLLLTPAIISCLIFILIPIVDSVRMSFTTYKIANLTKNIPGEWNNFANYTRLWESGKLMDSICVTLLFVFATVSLCFVISMALALMLNTRIRGARLLRSVMMLPWVIPTVISGLLWAWIFANPYGLFQYLVGVITGGRVQNFGILNNQDTALWGVIIAALWKQIPLMTLMFLAGMQNVPEDIQEAAKLDGAGYFANLFHIVFPSMRSVIAVTTSMTIIDNFKQYPLFATLTNGGPASATTTLAVLSYDEAFVNYNYGSGAAVTTVWLLLMVIVVFLFNAIFRKSDN